MEPIKTYTLYGVCITKIEAFDADFAGEGEAVEVSITFTYNYYKTDGSDVIYSE